MKEGVILDTELIHEADHLCSKAYKILSSHNLLDLAVFIVKQESTKKLSTYKYIKNLKEEIEDLRFKAKKAQEKCKSIGEDARSVTGPIGFNFPTLSNMEKVEEVSTQNLDTIKEGKQEINEVKVDNPNYNNNLQVYVGEIKNSLGLGSLEKEFGVKIENSEQLISILESLKEGIKDNKEEEARLEVVLRNLKRYQEIDQFENSYIARDDYQNSIYLKDTDRLEKEIDNVVVNGGSAVSVSSEYIEYKDIKNYLSVRQQEIMGYIYQTEGSGKAFEYYKKLEDQINQLKGMEKAIEEYEKIKNAGDEASSTTTTSSIESIYGGSSYGSNNLYYQAKKTSQEYMTEYMHSTIKGVVNGVEGFKESWTNINNSNATELDYERMYLIEALQNDKELANGLEETYQFGESVGNMLPTVVVGTAVTIGTGGAGAPAVVTNIISKATTSAMIFGSSYGSKKHQNLLSGYKEEDAKKSAVVSAISETVLEEALGTLPGIGKSSENAIINMIKEGGQEAVQEFVEKLGDKSILDQDVDFENIVKDASRSFIYGALISGTFQAGQSILYKGGKVVINNDTLDKLKKAVNSKSEVEVQKILKSLVENKSLSSKEETSNMNITINQMHNELQTKIKKEGVPTILDMNLQTFAYANVKNSASSKAKLRNISNKLSSLGYNYLDVLSSYYQTGNMNLITRKFNLREEIATINRTDVESFLSDEILRMQDKINKGQKIDENLMLKVYTILKQTPQVMNSSMNEIYEKNSFVAVSDFHGQQYALDKVKSHYLNEYETIFNLGDITDRGENNLSLLLDYMNLSKAYPGRVQYIPGNHDSFIYGMYMAKTEQERKNYRTSLIQNHGDKTYQDLENLRKTNPAMFQELITWLGKQPLQRVHQYEGKNYCFAHAFFNKNIYNQNPSYNLQDYMRDVTYDGKAKAASSPWNILWFRKKNTQYNKSDLPSSDYTMVVGHTPNANNLDLDHVNVICVDGGAYQKDANGKQSMRKFDGGSSPSITVSGEHTNTSKVKKSKEQNNVPIKDMIDEFVRSENNKHNSADYAQNLLYQYIYGFVGDNYITRQYRDLLSDQEGKKAICSYFGLDMKQVDYQKQVYNQSIAMVDQGKVTEAIRGISSTNNQMLISGIYNQAYTNALQMVSYGDYQTAQEYIKQTNNPVLITGIVNQIIARNNQKNVK